ncbi:ComEA family DNA-binding protein [Dyadobacter sp. CY343]|uniref:ComEA family DNA-binding protein n=1 Tax=Dyadobacter sp. CY343 TaxID=2907299 RepID=UPI001F4724C6|nr:helix-hairpin-helix domain-containing protein [Dyadobacter sp. CY343]MCE7058881.1 helix-hairpin-helix domain-containing protein [Dyadobacter sp. CY343]
MYKKLTALFQDYFGVSKKEARGALALILICVVLIWTPFVFRRFILPLMPPSTEPLTAQKLDSIVAGIETENALKRENDRGFSTRNLESKSKKPVRLFRFDPNTASVEQLTELGIPAFLAKRIDKFRSKGGKFRKKEDLLNIYYFPSDLYQKLEGYLVLPANENAQANTKFGESARRPNATGALPKYRTPTITAFDINTADTTQLVRLKGIGTKLSLRILKFRDGLGGFHSQNQFSEIFGLDSLALAELHKYASISVPVTKININVATAEELGRHSYLKNKKLVSIIINYRNQHGNYRNSDDLKKVKAIDEELIRKLEPYLSFD